MTMKKYTILLLALIFLLTTAGCTRQEVVTPEDQPDSSAPVTESPEMPLADIPLTFSLIENTLDEPFLKYRESYELIGNLENTKIRTHVNQSILKAVDAFKNNTYQMEKTMSQGNDIPAVAGAVGKATFFDNSLMSYKLVTESLSDGGAPYQIKTYFNFDLKTGQPIRLGDVISKNRLAEKVSSRFPGYKDAIDKLNYDASQMGNFYFTAPDEIIYVIDQYTFDYEQQSPLIIAISDISYDSSKKLMIGTAVKNGTRVISENSYEMYFSYPIFEDTSVLYTAINSEITESLNSVFDYGSSMAISDHNFDSQNSESADTSSEGDVISEPNSAGLSDGEASDYVLPPYWFNVYYNIYTNNEKILSFGLYDYQYTGGAHGLSVGSFYSYDLEKKKLIKLSDLFEPKFDYITYINDQIYRKIDSETKHDPESAYAYYDFNGITEDVKFYIEDNNLVIFFDQYEIAPYASGTPTFKIPLP